MRRCLPRTLGVTVHVVFGRRNRGLIEPLGLDVQDARFFVIDPDDDVL
jgi:hypothetical protein